MPIRMAKNNLTYDKRYGYGVDILLWKYIKLLHKITDFRDSRYGISADIY